MADNNLYTDCEKLPTTSNQPKKRGPYNQYLSEPQIKIPRTTLKRWPENLSTFLEPNDKNDVQSTAVPAAIDDEGIDNVDSVGHSDMFYSYETDQNLPSTTTEVTDFNQPVIDECDEIFESSDEFTDDDDDDLDSQVQTEKSLDPKLASVNAEVSDEKGEEYIPYLDELDDDMDINDTNDISSAENPLYDGAPISVAVSMLLIITFAIRHSLSGTALVDLLTLVSLHCALPNQCASSVALLKKFFMKLKNPIEFHYYCTFCMEYQGTTKDKICKNKSCLKDLSRKDNCSYFIIIPLMCQLAELLKGIISI